MGRILKKFILSLFLLTGLIGYQNCAPMEANQENQSELMSANQATFEAVESIIKSQCLICHATATAQNNFVSLSSFDDILLSGLVIPNQSGNSLLFQMVSSGQMPPNQPLPKVQIDLIKTWIDTGATGIEGTLANVPPTANAGVDRVITLPTNSIIITGTATDPDGSILSTTWSQISGPNTASLSGRQTLQLSASNLIAGTYVFEFLIKDDDDASSIDQVQLLVNPDPTPPPPPPATITFTQVNNTIITPICLTCHSGANPSGNFSMANYNSLMTRVVASNASNSLLYQKVLSNSMPKNGPPLSSANKKLIFDWIQAGALNN